MIVSEKDVRQIRVEDLIDPDTDRIVLFKKCGGEDKTMRVNVKVSNNETFSSFVFTSLFVYRDVLISSGFDEKESLTMLKSMIQDSLAKLKETPSSQ